MYRQVADQLRPSWSKLAAFMDDWEDDVLACMDFPTQHRAKLRSTNPLERLNKEVKRRADVVGQTGPCARLLPNDEAIVRLIGPSCSNPEIAHSAILAAEGTGDVRTIITDVSRAANETGGIDPVSVWGDAGVARDLVPGTVIPVALMCLTATPPIRLRARKGKTPVFGWEYTGSVVRRLPRNLLLRTVILCAVWLLLFVPVTVVLLWFSGLDTLPFAILMVFKAVYGFAVGATVCPFFALPAAARV